MDNYSRRRLEHIVGMQKHANTPDLSSVLQSSLTANNVAGQTKFMDAAIDATRGQGSLFNNVTKKLVREHADKLSAEELLKLSPQGYGAEHLGFRNNMRALGQQAKNTFSGGIRNSASNVYDALKRGFTESGGGIRGGIGTRMRYIPMGAKAGAMSSAIPEIAGAFKKEDETGEGRSQTERVGRAIGSVAGGLLGNLPASVTNRLGMVGAFAGGMGATMVGSMAGAALGGGVGKLVDKGVSSLRGVAAGDVTHQALQDAQRGSQARKRVAGSTAV